MRPRPQVRSSRVDDRDRLLVLIVEAGPASSRAFLVVELREVTDAAAMPALSFVQKFRDEFEFYVREGRSKVKGGTHAQM